MMIARIVSCSTSVMTRTVALDVHTVPIALLRPFRNDAKLAENTESALKSSKLLIEAMESEAIAALRPIRSLLSILERLSRKMSVTVA